MLDLETKKLRCWSTLHVSSQRFLLALLCVLAGLALRNICCVRAVHSPHTVRAHVCANVQVFALLLCCSTSFTNVRVATLLLRRVRHYTPGPEFGASPDSHRPLSDRFCIVLLSRLFCVFAFVCFLRLWGFVVLDLFFVVSPTPSFGGEGLAPFDARGCEFLASCRARCMALMRKLASPSSSSVSNAKVAALAISVVLA